MLTSKSRTPLPFIPISHQVERYLARLRRTVVFPCDPMDCYFELFPKQFREWVNVAGLAAGQTVNVKVQNVMRTIYKADQGTPIHFVSENQHEDWVFWIAARQGIPVPFGSAVDPMVLQGQHPFYTQLQSWLSEGYHLEGRIDAVLRTVRQLEKYSIGTGTLRAIWPELMNFVEVPVTRSKSTVPMRGLKLPDAEKDAVHTMLATAVMLPEQLQPLPAWVGFFTDKEV